MDFTGDLSATDLSKFDQSMQAFDTAWIALATKVDEVFHDQGRVAAYRFAATSVTAYINGIGEAGQEEPALRFSKLMWLVAAGFLSTLDLSHDRAGLEEVIKQAGIKLPSLEDLL